MGFVIHDLGCKKCSHVELNAGVEVKKLPKCSACGGLMEIRWDLDRDRRFKHTVDPGERTVVYRNPKTGHVVYPARNNAPMESRYVNQGYQREEMTSLRQLDKFCKENNVMNEKANFDRNGTADQF